MAAEAAAAGRPAFRTSRLLGRIEPRVALPALALVVMLVVLLVLQPNVLSYFGLSILLGFAIPLVLAAMAQMFIIAASDIDLGIGTFIALVSCIAATFLHDTPLMGWLALALCVLAYMAMGALIHLRRLPSIVVTLGASFVWLGLALLVLPIPGGAAPGWLSAAVSWQPPLVPLPIVVAVVAALVGRWLLMRSAFGVVLRGLGANPAALQRAGWSLLWPRVALYGLAGVSGVLAGLAQAALNTSGDATVGASYTLVSIAAVIVGGGEFVGGVVSPTGAVIGALIMLLTGALLSFFDVSTDWQLSVQGAILILVLATRAFGRRSA
jgi:ribose/xylose/arabinose/galactoside ABC-type transport system permease subunit